MAIRIREMEPLRRPLFTREDLFFCLELPLLGTIAWVAPEHKWRSLCYRLEWLKWKLAMFSPDRVADRISRVSAFLSVDEAPISFALRHAAIRSEHHLQILRSYRPGGWRPQLGFEGESILREALQAGNGAVLWVAHFGFNALATKVALGRAGFGVHHLSRPEHGFSKSRFGIRFLNPIRVHAELPHLAGRVIIDRSQSSQAKGEAERILESNGIISITAGAWEGRRIAVVDLFDGTMELATGAPSLAISSGAQLLPVFTVRDEKTGAIRVVVDAPIEQPKEGDKLEKIDRMTQEFADRLKTYIVEYPEQWRDWKNLRVGPG
jgi:hypothetical protein